MRQYLILVACIVLIPSSSWSMFGLEHMMQSGKPVASGSSSAVCNSPPVPAPAAAAGYNTLAFCADFNAATAPNGLAWTPTSNWIGKCGATTPVFSAWWEYHTPIVCGDYNIIADGTKQVLDIQFTATDASNAAGTVGGITLGTCYYDATGCFFQYSANNVFIEFRFKIPAVTLQNVTAPTGATQIVDVWGNYNGGSEPPLTGNGLYAEWDHIEYFHTTTPGSYTRSTGGLVWHSTGTNAGDMRPADASFDPTVFTTFSALITGDTTVNGSVCDFINGTFSACASPSPEPLDVGTVNRVVFIQLAGPSSANPNTAHVEFQYVRAWTCSSTFTGNNGFVVHGTCTHAPITSNPGNYTPPT